MIYAFGNGGNQAVFGLAENLERHARIGPLRIQCDGMGIVSEIVQVVGVFAYPFRFRVVSIFLGRPAQKRPGIFFVVRVDAGSRGQRTYRLAFHEGLGRVFRIQ